MSNRPGGVVFKKSQEIETHYDNSDNYSDIEENDWFVGNEESAIWFTDYQFYVWKNYTKYDIEYLTREQFMSFIPDWAKDEVSLEDDYFKCRDYQMNLKGTFAEEQE